MHMTVKICCILFLSVLSYTAHANPNDDLVLDIMFCESSLRPAVWGDGKHSYGIAQFRRDTFYELSKRAHLKGLNWKSATHQAILLRWAVDHGKGNRWTCFTKLTAGKRITH